MSDPDRELQEPKKQNDEPQKPERNLEEKFKKTPVSQVNRTQQEPLRSPNADSKRKQVSPIVYDRQAKAKAQPNATAQQAKPKEPEIRVESSLKNDGRKSPGANSKNTQQQESSGSSKNLKEHNKAPVDGPEVIWRHTVAAKQKVREMEKAAELQRRVKAKKILDAEKQAKQRELQQNAIGSIGLVSDETVSGERPTIKPSDTSSQLFYDALQSQEQKTTQAPKLSPKKEEASDTDRKPLGKLDLGRKAGETRIPSSRKKPRKRKFPADSDRKKNMPVTDGWKNKEAEFPMTKKQKLSPDAKGKSKVSARFKPKEKFLPKSDEKSKKQKPTSPKKLGPQPKLLKLKASEPSSSKKEESPKSVQPSRKDRRSSKVPPKRRKSSTVAVTSLEKEILNRTDPDLEAAIISSITFSFRFSEPSGQYTRTNFCHLPTVVRLLTNSS